MRTFRQLLEADEDTHWASMPHEHLHAETHGSLVGKGYWQDGDDYVDEDVEHHVDADAVSAHLHDGVLAQHGWVRTPQHDSYRVEKTHRVNPGHEYDDDDPLENVEHSHEWRHPNGARLTHTVSCCGPIPMESSVRMRAPR